MTAPHGSWPPSPKLLAAYFDGECEGRDDLSQLKQDIEAWLAGNPRAQEELAEYRRLLQAWHDTAPADPDPASWSALFGGLEAQTLGGKSTRLPPRQSRRRTAPVRRAAVTVAAACLAVALLWRPTPPAAPVQPPPAIVQAPVEDDDVLPVADVQEVVIVRVEGADTQTLVVGQLPVHGALELAAPGDVVLMRMRPDATDNMVPYANMNQSSTPLIWAKLDSERD